MLLIVGDLGFTEWSSHIELLEMILVVMLFVSVCCCIKLGRYDSVLAIFVVILLLAKLIFLLMRCSEGVGVGRVLVVC